MKEMQSRFSGMQSEAGLLDLLVTLAENIKLLVIGPLIAGLCAFGLSFMLPPTYQSISILQADQSAASLMLTAAVLDPVITALGLSRDGMLEGARRQLRAQIKTAIGRGDKLLTLTVSAPTAQQSQALASALLHQSYEESRPKGTARTRLETQLVEAQARLKSAQAAAANLLKHLESNGSGAGAAAEVARGFAELLNATGAAQTQISTLESQLEGLSEAQLLQPPTLPEEPSQPKKGLIALAAALAAGVALLLAVFMRQTFRTTLTNAPALEKVARIRQCLGLK